MTKQQQVQPEGITEELLLRSYNKTLEIVDEAKRINRASGISDWENLVQFEEEIPMTIIKYHTWADSVFNKFGKPNTLDSLITSGVIEEEERKHYSSETYPIRELINLIRVQARDGSEWLVRHEDWTGLDGKSGAVKKISVNNLDFYKKIEPEYTTQALDPSRRGTKNVRVAKIGRSLPFFEGSDPVFTNEFSRQSVEDAMSSACKPFTSKTIKHMSLCLKREGTTNTSIVRDLSTFITGDFNDLFESAQKPSSSKLDVKELVKELRRKTEQESKEQEHIQ